ncbi:MAG: hypothetical protein IJU70_06695 [Lentisphaeria bacterium]|nr:hypothetical protein [Lentisphaeria bacterium]
MKRAIAACCAAGALCGGCASAAAPPEHEKIGQALVDGLCSDRAEVFTSRLPDEIRKDFGCEEFRSSREKLCRTMGKPVAGRYAGRLEHPFFGIDLWKIAFERTGSGGETVRQEALFQVVSGRENGKNKIISFGFL